MGESGVVFGYYSRVGFNRASLRYWIKKPGFLPTGFLGSAKTDIPSTRTPKKPGFCEKPGFCWGQKRVGVALRMQHRSKNGEGIVEKTGFLAVLR